MYISSISPASAASAVWAAATRTLTSLATPGPMPPTSFPFTPIAAGTTLSLQTGGNSLLEYVSTVSAGAAGSVSVNLTDGTNVVLAQTVSAGNIGVASTRMCTIVVWNTYVNNDVINAAHFMAAGNFID